MLCTDLFYEISLYCKPYLLSINKELHSLYNDEWFKTFLENKYPNKKLFTSTNYLNLYRKSLHEGIIYSAYSNSFDYKLTTKGVRAQYNSGDYILTFNGELYYETNKIIFIDNEVIDISSFGYIKETKAYIIYNGIMELQFNNKLLRIICYYNMIYILAADGVYLYELLNGIAHKLRFYEIKNPIDLIHKRSIYVINNDNEIYLVNNCGIFPSSVNIKSKLFNNEISYDKEIITMNSNNVYVNNELFSTNVKKIIHDDNNNKIWYYIKNEE